MYKEIRAKGFEVYIHDEEVFCMVLRDDFESSSISFFTPDDFSIQLGYLPHKKGAAIAPHFHKPAAREILYTNEVLLVKKGVVKVNLYGKAGEYLDSILLHGGDTILLNSGGHGFEIQEDTVMIEVKQGPYMGMNDKERFSGIEGK